MKSAILVISWWSNCIGLRCLYHLKRFVRDRQVYVLQVGKSARQMRLFRKFIPEGVFEIVAERSLPGEHGAICELAVRQFLKDEAGIWFWDHDFFLLEDAVRWLDHWESKAAHGNYAMVIPEKPPGMPITNPLFWLAPGKYTPDAPSLRQRPAPQPELVNFPFRRVRRKMVVSQPQLDTLIAYRDFCESQGNVLTFQLEGSMGDLESPLFPQSVHIGGLYLLSLPGLPIEAWPRLYKTIDTVRDAVINCPKEWVATEDPLLLKKLSISKFPIANGTQA